MSQRHSHLVGDFLAVDDVTGVTYYGSQLVKDWDGSYRLPKHLDGQHPDFLRRRWPREESPSFATGAPPLNDASDLTLPTYIGSTTVLRRVSPADVIF